MTDAELREIEEREKKATPGPWRALESGNQFLYDDRDHGYLPSAPVVAASRIPAIPRPWNPHAVIGFRRLEKAWISRFLVPDAEFIAHAREDIPALLAEVRRLKEEER